MANTSAKRASHSETPLTVEESALQEAADIALEAAKKAGASAVEVGVNRVDGLSYSVRNGETETIERNQDKGLDLRVFIGAQTASSSTTDFSREAIEDTVRAAIAIAKETEGDHCMGLADARDYPSKWLDLDLHHPHGMEAAELSQLAHEQTLACETTARADSRISNTEGATFNAHEGVALMMNSNGFCGFSRGTRYGLSCSVLAGEGDHMQRDYWYDSNRQLDQLQAAEQIGERAAQRTLARLGAQKLSTRNAPVIYDATVASGLIGHFINAIKGQAIHKKASFLLDCMGKPIFPAFMSISQKPHLKAAMGSSIYDSDGVATRELDYVIDGILSSYVLSHYSACKLDIPNTGNAGGTRNLHVSHGDKQQDALLKDMGTGLLVTELMGFGVNGVTGDYSRGASGFWVENGEIQHPVEEITLSSNLKDMFAQISDIGADVDTRGNIRCGSILIDNMTIGGS